MRSPFSWIILRCHFFIIIHLDEQPNLSENHHFFGTQLGGLVRICTLLTLSRVTHFKTSHCTAPYSSVRLWYSFEHLRIYFNNNNVARLIGTCIRQQKLAMLTSEPFAMCACLVSTGKSRQLWHHLEVVRH